MAKSPNKSGLLLTPTLDRVQISSINVSGWQLPGSIADGVGDALSHFIAAVNGQIKPIPIDIVTQLASTTRLSVGDRSITIPAQLITSQGILIDEDRMVWLAQINGPIDSAPSLPAPSFNNFKTQFLATLFSGSGVVSGRKDGRGGKVLG